MISGELEEVSGVWLIAANIGCNIYLELVRLQDCQCVDVSKEMVLRVGWLWDIHLEDGKPSLDLGFAEQDIIPLLVLVAVFVEVMLQSVVEINPAYAARLLDLANDYDLISLHHDSGLLVRDLHLLRRLPCLRNFGGGVLGFVLQTCVSIPAKGFAVECSNNQSSLGIVVASLFIEGENQCLLLLVWKLILGRECIYGKFENVKGNHCVGVIDECQVVLADAYDGAGLLDPTHVGVDVDWWTGFLDDPQRFFRWVTKVVPMHHSCFSRTLDIQRSQ